VLAQRHVERGGKAQDHLPAGRRPSRLEEAQMALGDLGRAGELQLRHAALAAPPAQAMGEPLACRRHDGDPARAVVGRWIA